MKPRRILVAALCASLVATLVPLLATAASNDSVESSAEVSNEPPTNLQITIAGDADDATPGVQIAPDASGTTTITITGRAEDGNGWKDLKKATFEIFRPDGAPLAGAEGTPEAEGNGRKRAYTYTFTMSSQNAPGDYVVRLKASDKQDTERTLDAIFTFQEHLALSLDNGQVSFGAGLGPGQSTHGSPASVTVNNLGNVRLDLLVSASPLRQVDGDGAIGPDRIRYATSATMDAEVGLSEAGTWDTAFDLPPGASKIAYLDVHMPTGDEQYVPAGRYVGTITFGGASG